MKMNYKDGSWEQAIGKLISDIRHEEPLYTINDDPRSLWTKSEGMRNMLWVQQFAHYCINQLAMIGAWDRAHDGHTVAQATAIHRPAPTTTEELAAALAGGGDPWDIAYVKELEL